MGNWECLDLMDYIFSLLGIVNTQDEFLHLYIDPSKSILWLLRPDYSLSTREAFTKATKTSIYDHQHLENSLEVLVFIQTGKIVRDLPS
jgi:hypothetical protein